MAERPSAAAVLRFCREANEVAKEAVAVGSHPFGAVLASETGEILLRQGNIDTVNHAESTLARQAYKDLSFEQLQKCTLYSTFEPCAVRVYSSVYSPPKPVSST
jgi:tRNA(Arg) A34 adenosine deaminase TadA